MTKMFSGDLHYLSNFSYHIVQYDNFVFPTLENAYQAAKTTSRANRATFVSLTPGQAKRRGRQLGLREDWEQVKLPTMRKLLMIKFALNPELIDKLIFTGNLELVETNTWHDQIWGSCVCPEHVSVPGQNLLGGSLMWLRYYLAGGGSN